ncbi:MAG: hypothetical protein CMP38_02920 [Rickettsiales bacterium]|nr:hypothetical protein [Rickettsiales bacterium]OUW04482.1 MAG: hypothetical protein CBD16_02215 [Betaproteobacteria bacterium TMED156]
MSNKKLKNYHQCKMVISKKNSHFKRIIKILSSSKFRHQENLFWLEGEKLCSTFAQNVGFNENSILVYREKLNISTISKILGITNQLNFNYLCLSSSLFSEVSQVENGSGWGLVVSHPNHLIFKNKKFNDVVVLDGIQDPGNLGNIIRTTASLGINDIFLTKGCVDAFSPKVIRSGCGGHFLIRISFFEGLSQIIEYLNARKIQILATFLSDDSQNLYGKNVKLKKNCAWIFGNEGAGLSKLEIYKNKLDRVKIPIIEEIESLNVASAVAICLFEMKRRRKNFYI